MLKKQLERISCYSKLMGSFRGQIPSKVGIASVGVISDEKLLVLHFPMRSDVSTKAKPSLEQCSLHVRFVDGSIVLVADQ